MLSDLLDRCMRAGSATGSTVSPPRIGSKVAYKEDSGVLRLAHLPSRGLLRDDQKEGDGVFMIVRVLSSKTDA